jgi:hypothetical protein
MSRTTDWGLLVASVLVGSGCGGPAEPAPETAGGALNGTVHFPSVIAPADCFWIEQQDILTSARSLNHWIRVDPGRMTECLKDSFLSFENHQVNPSYPEEIMAELGEDVRTSVRCRDLAGNGKGTSEDPFETETVFLDRDLLATRDLPRIMSVMLHEVSHAHGYKHPVLDGFPTRNSREYDATVPEQVEQCILTLARSQPVQPHGGRRSALRIESTLAKVGGLGGAPYELACPGGQVAFGINLRAGAEIDSVGLACRAPFGTLTSDTFSVGGGGGGPVRLECLAGEVLVGMHGRAGKRVDHIGPVCATVDEVRNNGTNAFRDPGAGGGGGVAWDRQCPPGMAVRGLRGRSGQKIDQMEMDCQALGATGLQVTNLPRIAPAPGGIHRRSLERCAGRSALVGLAVSSGNMVDRLGGYCAQIATSSGIDRPSPAPPHVLPANGAEGGSGGDLMCGVGEALVGLHHRTGAGLDAIGPVCASVDSWSRDPLVAPVTPTAGGLAGGPGGGYGQTICPRGSFVVGWDIYFLISGVFSVVPQCRDFI